MIEEVGRRGVDAASGRSWLALIVGAVVLLSSCTTRHVPPANVPTQWTAFRYNSELNAVVATADRGAFRWVYRTHGGISSSPTVSGDTLFVAANDRALYALDRRSGRLRWKYVARDEVMTAPLVYKNVVVIGEGNNHAGPSMFDPPHYLLLGDGSNALIGLDATTGRERWRRTVPGSAMPTGAIVGGDYIEHDAAGMIFSYAVTDGTYRWRRYVGSTAAMVAANRYHGDDVASAGDYPNEVISLNGRSGELNWRRSFPASAGGFDDCPLASDGRAIFGIYNARPSDSRFGFVAFTTPAIQHAYALDARTGDVAWDVPLIRGILPVNNSTAIPLLYNGRLYFGSAMSSMVFALDARSGSVVWSHRVNGRVKGGMVGVNGNVYFGDSRGSMWALDATTGAIRGRTSLHDGIGVGSPIVVGQSLIIGSLHGSVYSIPLLTLSNDHR